MKDAFHYVRHTPGAALQEARLAAWTIMIGRHNRYESRSRPHRGMLPDVDFDVPPPVRRSVLHALAAWLARWFGDVPSPAADTGLSAATAADVGKPPELAYIGEAEAAPRQEHVTAMDRAA